MLKPKKITLAYFSGTGCTKEVCLCFAQQLAKKGLESKTISLENIIFCWQNPRIVFLQCWEKENIWAQDFLALLVLKDGFHLQELKKLEYKDFDPDQTKFNQNGAWKGVSEYLK
ncbi:hypothetical protein RZO55_07885 [Clostridium boliviensis]|uniref:Flavodoxin-like domain-containing protein n=1 Tax=Clostridium boliviensis TaxID=318465 RepID=A0ABU4GIP4_9CLOT|nr:hypothetical protein [Clostridium boliviensis]MDW2797493.1 hypothetical protein [Clostridium boliviensis]